jgi:hypothetical protein
MERKPSINLSRAEEGESGAGRDSINGKGDKSEIEKTVCKRTGLSNRKSSRFWVTTQ